MCDARQSGFTLLEVSVSLLIVAIASSVALPVCVHSLDRARLLETGYTLAEQLRLQQMSALTRQEYQEVRLTPEGNSWTLYGNQVGYEGVGFFSPGITYEDGYLHLPEPTVRFIDTGTVSESGQIGLIDPEGDKFAIVVCLGSGTLRFARGLDGSSLYSS